MGGQVVGGERPPPPLGCRGVARVRARGTTRNHPFKAPRSVVDSLSDPAPIVAPYRQLGARTGLLGPLAGVQPPVGHVSGSRRCALREVRRPRNYHGHEAAALFPPFVSRPLKGETTVRL